MPSLRTTLFLMRPLIRQSFRLLQNQSNRVLLFVWGVLVSSERNANQIPQARSDALALLPMAHLWLIYVSSVRILVF